MGILFNKYEVLDTLREDSLIKARNIDDDNTVLLKIAGTEYSSDLEEHQFQREFEISKLLSSTIPEVIKAVEFISTENKKCSVYEFFNGYTIKDYLEIGLESQLFWIQKFIKIAEVIGEIHKQGIIHKDISPSNIMYSPEDGDIKIIDFGLSSSILSEKNIFTSEFKGHHGFISPEQTGRVNRVVDKRSDYYSLGMTFYYCLNGSSPFGSDDISSVIYHQIATLPQPLSKKIDVSINVSNIIDKLIRKNPDDRYQTVDGLMHDLKKALSMIEEGRGDQEFQLGEHDYSTLEFPQTLFGREFEIEKLVSVFNQSITDFNQILFVRGATGVGKSSLVYELQEAVAVHKGIFISGKYEQYRCNVPYYGVGKILSEYINHLKHQDLDNAILLLNEISNELGEKLGIIIQTIPELGVFFETNIVNDDLSIKEHETSFVTSFVNFFTKLTGHSSPLVLFFDDIQWCDEGSIKLFEKLFLLTDLKNITIVCGFRKENCVKGTALYNLYQNFRDRDNCTIIDIKPLDSNSVTEFMEALFRGQSEEIDALSLYVYNKSRGYPLLVQQILKTLFSKNLFSFNSSSSEWSWVLNEIETCDISGDISELLLSELHTISSSMLQILKYASCIGSTFSVKDLFLFENKIPDLKSDVVALIRLGYILPLDINYKLISSSFINLKRITKSFPIPLKFQHDSIQQVVYGLLTNNQKESIHLSLGLNALGGLSDSSHRESIIEVAIHFLYCLEILPEEYFHSVIELLMKAADYSMKSSSYELALDFSSKLKSILPSNPWISDYKLSRTVNQLLMKSQYLTGQVKVAEETANEIIKNSQSEIDKAELCKIQMGSMLFLGDLKGSIDKGYEALSFLDYKIARKQTTSRLVIELLKVKIAMAGKSPGDLYCLDEGKDERIALILSILSEFIVPSFISGEANLFGVATLKQIQLTLKHGCFKESVVAFSNYAILLSGMGEYKSAYNFAELGMKLNSNYNSVSWKTMIYSNYTLFTLPWNKPWEEFSKFSKKTIDIAMENGEQFLLAHHCGYINQWNPGITLNQAIREGSRYIQIAQDTGQEGASILSLMIQNRWLCLNGQLASNLSLDSENFNSEEVLKRLGEINYISGICIYHLQMMIILYHYESYDSALDHMKKTEKYIQSLEGSAYIFDFTIYGLLILSALLFSCSHGSRKRYLKSMTPLLKRLGKWSKLTPENFLHYYTIFKAEYLYHKGETTQGNQIYKQADKLLEECSILRDKAIILEILARHYSHIGESRISQYLLYNSYKDYLFWGAVGKAKHMKETYASIRILEKSLLTSPLENSIGSFSSSLLNANQLIDLMSIIKVSQAISSELHLDNLFKIIVDTVLKNMGAEKAYFIYEMDGEWIIFSDSSSAPLGTESNISYSIFLEAVKNHKPICLDDALNNNKYKTDEYIIMNNVRSLFCFPLLSKGNVIGLWYLENNLIPGAFGDERQEILTILSAQITISLENARIYRELDRLNKNLEQSVEERTRELQVANCRLKQLSITDNLTQLYNRYKVDEIMTYETNRFERFENPLAMLILDIDNFKSVNDEFGHLIGDEVLKHLSGILKNTIRVTDSVARWGGEEFIVVLPGTDLTNAGKIAEEIRNKVETDKDFPSGVITVSIGVSEYKSGLTVKGWIENADNALYIAKEEGRNKVVLF